MYDKLMGLLTDLQNVGKALDRAQSEHRNALNKLATGRGNLLGRAERVRELGAKTAKALPAGFAATHHAVDDDGSDDSDDG